MKSIICRQKGSRRLVAKITLTSAMVASVLMAGCGSGLSFPDASNGTKLTACSDVNLKQSSSLYSISMKVTCSFGTNDIAAPITSAMPAGGVYGSTISASFASNEPVTIYYTTDGSVPTTASAVYSTPLTVAASMTLSYLAVDTVGNKAETRTVNYVIDATKTTVKVTNQETFFSGLVSNSVSETSSLKVTWTSAKTGTVVVSAGYGDVAGATEIKTFAYAGGSTTTTINGSDLQNGLNNVYLYFQDSGSAGGYLMIEANKDGVYPNTVPSVDGVFFNTSFDLTLSTNEGSRTYYYEQPNVIPAAQPAKNLFTLYSAPININGDKTIWFYSVDYAGNEELMRKEEYDSDIVPITFSALTPIDSADIANTGLDDVIYLSTGSGNTSFDVKFTMTDDTLVSYYNIELCADATCNTIGSGTKILRNNIVVNQVSYSATETIDISEVNEGLNYVSVIAVDVANNPSPYHFRIIRDSIVKTPVPIYPQTGAFVKANSGNVDISWTNTCPTETVASGGSFEKTADIQVASDAAFTAPTTKTITFSHGDAEACTGLTSIDTNFKYYTTTVAASLSANNQYFYRVRLTDKAGNVSPYSPAIPFYYNTTKAKNDINGDGYSDVVIGVPEVGATVGKVYVYLGGAMTDATVDLTITGDTGGSTPEFGYSVDILDNVDGSGNAAIIVGSKGYAGSNDGRVYIFLNAKSKCAMPCTTTFASADIVLNTSVGSGDQLGYVVKDLGDINQDGKTDFAITAPEEDSAGFGNNGAVYVFYGKTGWINGITVDLSNASDANYADFKIVGQKNGEKLGLSLNTAGDINQDGFPDFLVGSPFNSTAGGTQAGSAYVVMGSASTISLNYTFENGVTQDLFGQYLSGGDLNNDGYSDFLISDIQFASSSVGKASLFIGGNNNASLDYFSAATFPTVSSSSVVGTTPSLNLGSAMAIIPNLDGSQTAGFLVCSTVYTVASNANAGKCDLKYLTGVAINSVVNTNIAGSFASQSYGATAKYIGDINNDGLGDFAVSSIGTGSAGGGKGQVNLYLGSATLGSISSTVQLVGETVGDKFGAAIGGE